MWITIKKWFLLPYLLRMYILTIFFRKPLHKVFEVFICSIRIYLIYIPLSAQLQVALRVKVFCHKIKILLKTKKKNLKIFLYRFETFLCGLVVEKSKF